MSSKQVSHHQSPSKVFCCFITALSFIVVVPTVWITSTLLLRNTGELNYPAKVEGTGRSLSLRVDHVSASIPDNTMAAEWLVEKDTCSDSNCTDVEIFFNTHLTPSDIIYEGDSIDDQSLTAPNLTWYTTLSGTRRNRDTTSFNTKLTLYGSNNPDQYSGYCYENSLIYYPFDRYEAVVSVFARDTSTNQSVYLQFSSGSRILIGHLVKIAPTGPSLLQDTDQIWYINFNIRRNTVSIMYCLVVTVTFWLITLMICLIMITTVVFGFRQRNEIVIAPIATVFTFIQLRTSMPGAPQGFGNSIDYIGVLPCLIFLSISTIAMVGIYLFADPDDPSRRSLTWSDLENAFTHYSKRSSIASKKFLLRARFRLPMLRRIGKKVPHEDEIPLVNTASENSV